MDYKNSKAGFTATLTAPDKAKKDESSPAIGFTAAVRKGIGDPKREPAIGFTAKLQEPEKAPPQLSFDF